ncbi:MAG: type II toxin-antitoxin system VapC family toxin [Gemmatimonadaceae bacterium]
MKYLLDTDVVIEVLREREPVRSRVRRESPDDLAVATMTEAELRYGARNSRDPARALTLVETFLSAPIERVAFDSEAAAHHADVRFALRSRPIGERDLVIASTALARRLVVVTGNTREFERVPGLVVEFWGAK